MLDPTAWFLIKIEITTLITRSIRQAGIKGDRNSKEKRKIEEEE
jgi:hypothetical protein